MRKPPSSKPPHLQLVPSQGTPPAPESNSEPTSEESFDAIYAADFTATPLRPFWGYRLTLLGSIASMLVLLWIGWFWRHYRPNHAASAYDGKRFSMTVRSCPHHAGTEIPEYQLLMPGDTVHADDAFSFEMHNRSHQNVWFGVAAISDAGQFFWFYPRNGEGQDVALLPLPAIPTLSLPEGIEAHDFPPGRIHFVGMFLPQRVEVSQIESTFHAAGFSGLQHNLNAQLSTVDLKISAP